jgi:chromosome segregation ATPase
MLFGRSVGRDAIKAKMASSSKEESNASSRMEQMEHRLHRLENALAASERRIVVLEASAKVQKKVCQLTTPIPTFLY